MGSGIAQAFAQVEGFSVRLCDLSVEIAQRGKDRIAANLSRRVAKGAISEAERESVLERIRVGAIDAVAEAELVVEAAVEQMAVKRELLGQIASLCEGSALITTNTSSLSVTELTAAVGRPVVGMHFFNPAPSMKLVEVVSGIGTPPELVEQVEQVAVSIGKHPVRVQDSAGFVVNRILIPMVNEAVGILAEGVASAEDIDNAMKLGAGHPMGPLATGDLVGLDVILAIMEVLNSETGDPKYRPHPMLRSYVRAGWLGRKSGRGFFDYQNGTILPGASS